MTILFSDKEAAILLGATLMHWGVPFRFSAKRELTDAEQTVVDGASDKLIASREEHPMPIQSGRRKVELSRQEVALLAEVVEACGREIGDDPVELDIQLHTRQRGEVEALVERLRGCAKETP